MFENLFASKAACIRHSAGPLAAERNKYLRHCAEQGGTRASLRLRAGSLLRVAERMRPTDREGVDAARLCEIVQGGLRAAAASPTTAATLTNSARPWLKFLGWWRQPQAPIPFAQDLERFVSWMRDERGLTSCTVSQWQSRAATFLRWCASTGRNLETLRPEDIDAYFVTGTKVGAVRFAGTPPTPIVTSLRC